MVKCMWEDGVDHKQMVQVFVQHPWSYLVMLCLMLIKKIMLWIALCQELNLIWIGSMRTGDQTVVICGNKLEAVTSSGTEILLFMPWTLLRNSSKRLVIAHMLPLVLQQKMMLREHWIAIGQEPSWNNLTTDRKIHLSFMHFLHSEPTLSRTIKLLKQFRHSVWLSVQSIRLIKMTTRLTSQECCWADIQVTAMQEETHGNCWLLS